MSNIARNSKFNIRLDYDRSSGSFIYDKNSKRKILDFFGMYSSLPLGYNHKIFEGQDYISEMLRVSKVKTNNCEFTSDEVIEFDEMFKEFCGAKNCFIHYTCTGALAIESAIKVALQYKKFHKLRVLSFDNSFHGINSYGSFVTSRFPGVDFRLKGIPDLFSVKIEKNLHTLEQKLKTEKFTCVLVEPIQCTAGDIHLDKEFLIGVRNLCARHDVPFIVDEIQTGFGTTGKCWYHEHFSLKPDIMVFGKKTQMSGIIVSPKISKCLENNSALRLQVTWDGDPVDMIRCKYIMRALQQEKLIEKATEKGDVLKTALEKLPAVDSVRNAGLLIGIDLTSPHIRDKIVEKLFDNGLICNKTGYSSIRLRPSLSISDVEILQAIDIFRLSFKECE